MRMYLDRRQFLATAATMLPAVILTGCSDVDPGLDENTPMPDAKAVAEELRRSGAVDIPFSIADDTDADADPLLAEYMFRTEDDRKLSFKGWVSTAEVSWYNWLQGYKRYWGCDYAQTIRALNLSVALEAGRKYLDAKRFLADDSESAIIVLLDSRDQVADAAQAINAAWKAVNAAEKDRHTKEWLACDDAYGLEISLRIAAPESNLDPSDYLGGDSACLYYTGNYTPYGAGEREFFDAESFVSAAFDKVEAAQD